jgi:hypothetical protein
MEIKKEDKGSQSVRISNTAKFTVRSLKHFAQSRIAQGNSWNEIIQLLKNARRVSEMPEVIIFNPKQDKYPQSLLLGVFYKELDKAIILILDAGDKPRDIVSLHFKKRKDFEKLLCFAGGGAAYPS